MDIEFPSPWETWDFSLNDSALPLLLDPDVSFPSFPDTWDSLIPESALSFLLDPDAWLPSSLDAWDCSSTKPILSFLLDPVIWFPSLLDAWDCSLRESLLPFLIFNSTVRFSPFWNAWGSEFVLPPLLDFSTIFSLSLDPWDCLPNESAFPPLPNLGIRSFFSSGPVDCWLTDSVLSSFLVFSLRFPFSCNDWNGLPALFLSTNLFPFAVIPVPVFVSCLEKPATLYVIQIGIMILNRLLILLTMIISLTNKSRRGERFT